MDEINFTLGDLDFEAAFDDVDFELDPSLIPKLSPEERRELGAWLGGLDSLLAEHGGDVDKVMAVLHPECKKDARKRRCRRK